MPVFKGDNGHNEPNKKVKANFDNCLLYVKRTWPDESEEIQIIRAEAVYAISEVFFNEIIPAAMQKQLTFSLN